MGYLDKSSVTIDAILTKKGRELLAQGADKFKITQFAIGDDEVDYRLYNTAHPLGSQYYGAVIENMPIMEASPDETQALKSKLVTLDTPTAGGVPPIPIVSINLGTINFTFDTNDPAKSYEFTPTTTFGFNGAQFGYTVTISDKSLAELVVLEGQALGSRTPVVPATTNSATAQVVVGTKFKIVPKNATGTAILTVVGNETGGTQTDTLTFTESEN